MNEVVIGALVGLGIGVVLFVFELIATSRSAAERAKRMHQKVAKRDATEEKALRTLLRFVLILPFAFALGAWVIWG